MSTQREIQKKIWVKRLNFIWYKVSAIIWISLAIYVIHATNYFRLTYYSECTKKVYFYLGYFVLLTLEF